MLQQLKKKNGCNCNFVLLLKNKKANNMFIQSGKVKTVSALYSSISLSLSLSLSNVFLIQSNLFLLRHFSKPQTFRNFVCV